MCIVHREKLQHSKPLRFFLLCKLMPCKMPFCCNRKSCVLWYDALRPRDWDRAWAWSRGQELKMAAAFGSLRMMYMLCIQSHAKVEGSFISVSRSSKTVFGILQGLKHEIAWLEIVQVCALSLGGVQACSYLCSLLLSLERRGDHRGDLRSGKEYFCCCSCHYVNFKELKGCNTEWPNPPSPSPLPPPPPLARGIIKKVHGFRN